MDWNAALDYLDCRRGRPEACMDARALRYGACGKHWPCAPLVRAVPTGLVMWQQGADVLAVLVLFRPCAKKFAMLSSGRTVVLGRRRLDKRKLMLLEVLAVRVSRRSSFARARGRTSGLRYSCATRALVACLEAPANSRFA